MEPEQSKTIETLYLQMFVILMQYARSALKNEALAEEAVQETFRVACQKPDDLCASPNPKGWLMLTLKNVIRNIRRNTEANQRLLAKYIAAQPKEISRTEEGIQIHLLYSDVMETEDFNLMVEMAIEKRFHKEMAESRGITVDACKKRVQRAKVRLKEKLKD